ncbi:MAG: ATP-binding protein [Planctomycetota bacterium]
MTERELQEKLRTERLAQLGSVLAGFAHEIRNPLSTIGLNLQLVKEDFVDAESSRDRRTFKRLSVVEGEVKRLQTILEEFLGFVRSPAPQADWVHINKLLQALSDLSTPEMKTKGVSLKFFPGSKVERVPVDADQFRAAVVNLLRNALDACAPGDEVLLSSRRLQGEVIVQVTDTGAGMTEAVLRDVFTPYFSTKKDGTGLGLAMVQRTVEEHGGKLEVSSEAGRGTQFTIRLPAPESSLPDTATGGQEIEP